jgi:hypothetical protein
MLKAINDRDSDSIVKLQDIGGNRKGSPPTSQIDVNTEGEKDRFDDSQLIAYLRENSTIKALQNRQEIIESSSSRHSRIPIQQQESIDHYGFCLQPIFPSVDYFSNLHRDISFYNPSSVALMLKNYSVDDIYTSIIADENSKHLVKADDQSWDYEIISDKYIQHSAKRKVSESTHSSQSAPDNIPPKSIEPNIVQEKTSVIAENSKDFSGSSKYSSTIDRLYHALYSDSSDSSDSNSASSLEEKRNKRRRETSSTKKKKKREKESKRKKKKKRKKDDRS